MFQTSADKTDAVFSFETSPWLIPKEFIKLYTEKTAVMYIHQKLWYRDADGKPHWTKICATHEFGWSLDSWQFCEKGNNVDHEK